MSKSVAQVFAKVPHIYCSIAQTPTQEAMRNSVVRLLGDTKLLETLTKRL